MLLIINVHLFLYKQGFKVMSETVDLSVLLFKMKVKLTNSLLKDSGFPSIWKEHFFNFNTNFLKLSIRLLISHILRTPPTLSTLFASRMKSTTLEFIRDKQNTHTSTEDSGSGTLDISQAVTRSFTATRSNEWTTFGTERANRALPQPKSAIINVSGSPLTYLITWSNGSRGHFEHCSRKPSW